MNSKTPSNVPVVLVGQPKCLSTESYSLLLLTFSSFLYSIMGCFVKLAVRSGIPSSELVFLRALFQGSLVVLGMFYYTDGAPSSSDADGGEGGVALIRRPFGSTKSIQRIVIARGAVGGLGFLFYFYTMSVLPLGDAVALLSINPVITILAASIFLHEAIHKSHAFAVVACITGSVLLAHPSFLFGGQEQEESNDKQIITVTSILSSGYLSAFLGACCGAGVFILIRRAGQDNVHTLQLLFSWSAFAIIFSFLVGVILPTFFGIGSPFVMPHYSTTTTEILVWFYILGICIIGSFAHFFFNYAGRHAPAGIASIVRSTGIMWSYMLEIWVFHEVPQASTIGGVALIVLALIVISWEKHYHHHQEMQKNHDKIITKKNSDAENQMELQSNTYGSTDVCDDGDNNKDEGAALLKNSN